MDENLPANTGADEVRAKELITTSITNPKIFQVVQRFASLHPLLNAKAIETQVEYDQAIDSFDEVKKGLKELEDLRTNAVALPNLMTKSINDFFRPLRQTGEKLKKHVGDLIAKKKAKDEEAAQRQREIVAQTAVVVPHTQTPEGAVTCGGMTEFSVTPDIPLPASNVISSERGAKVHTRTDLCVEVSDLEEFVKACVSKNKRNLWLSERIEEVLSVNIGPLKALIREERKKKAPGLLIETKETVI